MNPPTATDTHLAFGAAGEALAATFLRQQGFTIIGRNFRCATGEIDLIATAGDLLVFVEVRARRSDKFLKPLETLTAPKLRRLRRTAEWFLLRHRPRQQRLRFDVITVTGDRVEHLPDAFALEPW
jgi:putative endonuclease